METDRFPSHSGSWYDDSAEALKDQLQTLLNNVKHSSSTLSRPKAIICPHAGYRYCGKTAAHCWKSLLPYRDTISRVVILAPSHYFSFSGIALPFEGCERYLTPLGAFSIDRKAVAQLEMLPCARRLSRFQDETEHAVEMMLPFLHAVYSVTERKTGHAEQNFTLPHLVPLLVSSICKDGLDELVTSALTPFFEDPNTFFVISSDFCHWGMRFHYLELPGADISRIAPSDVNDNIKRLDMAAIRCITDQNFAQFSRYIDDTGNTICGENPIKLFLKMLESASDSFKTELLHYSQSTVIRDIKNDTSVSYAALVTSYVDQV